MSSATDTKVFDDEVREDAVLEKLGYQQELKRSFGLLGMIGFAFSIVTSWTALGGVLIVGVESGVHSPLMVDRRSPDLIQCSGTTGHDMVMDSYQYCDACCSILNG